MPCQSTAGPAPSILAFTEWNFNLPRIAPPFYADANAPDVLGGNTALLDFFKLTQPRTFVPVPTGQWTYNCFKTWGSCAGTQGPYVAEDPDDY